MVLIKEDFGDIALIMQSLVSLLNPLQWNFTFITYLTPNMIDYLEAPFPYIIGVSKKIWEDICSIREYPDDIIIYDIDKQHLVRPLKEDLPPLPEPQASSVLKTLKSLLDMKEDHIDRLIEESSSQSAPIERTKAEEFH